MHRKIIHSLNLIFKSVNKIFSGKPRRSVVIGRALMATILGLLLSTCLVEPLSMSTSAMFSAPEKRDFQMPDLFAQIADNRPVRTFDDRIILINIGRSGREEIAEGLSLLSLCGPKAIGVDINFAEPGDNDDFLISSIENNSNLVLPLGVDATKVGDEFKVVDKPFFYDECPDLKYGIVNFPMQSMKGTIREYTVDFKTDEGILPSFMSALAEAADPQAMEKLKARGVNNGVTAYHSREYLTIELNEIEDHAEDFADKIVIIGALEDAADMHSTPVKSHVAGMMLHAYALSTVLDGIWYTKIPKTYDYILALALCLCIMLVVFGFRNNFRGIVLRIIQATLAYLAVRVGYSLFVDHDIIFDLSYTILIIAFGLFAADIWNGLELLWNICANKLEKLESDFNEKRQLC